MNQKTTVARRDVKTTRSDSAAFQTENPNGAHGQAGQNALRHVMVVINPVKGSAERKEKSIYASWSMTLAIRNKQENATNYHAQVRSKNRYFKF